MKQENQNNTANKKQNKPRPKTGQDKTDVQLSELGSFEQNLRKQIRNRTKKLDQIEELVQKMKKEKFEPNEAQKTKISQKEQLLAQITEINEYLAIYLQDKKEEARRAKEVEKKHAKEIRQTKEQIVKQLGELICMSTIGAFTQYKDMPAELQDGLKYVQENMQGMLGQNSDGSKQKQLKWKLESAKFSKDFSELIALSKKPIGGVSISCEDLVKQANEQLKTMPDTVDFVVSEPDEPAQDVPGEEAAEEQVPVNSKNQEEDTQKQLQEKSNVGEMSTQVKPPQIRKERRKKDKPAQESENAAPDAEESKEVPESSKKTEQEANSKPKNFKNNRKNKRNSEQKDEAVEVKPREVSGETKEEKVAKPVETKDIVLEVAAEPKEVEKKVSPKVEEPAKKPAEGEEEKKDGGDRKGNYRVRDEKRSRGGYDGERGDRVDRGRDGERGRGRGRGRGGRGRGGFRNREGEDEDGFIEVGTKDRADRGRGGYRGRGRGYRGRGGADGEAGGEFRGRGRGGDRGQRRKRGGEDQGPKEDVTTTEAKEANKELTAVLEPKQQA